MIGLLALIACRSPDPTETEPRVTPDNILVFLLDDVGVERIGLYDHHGPEFAQTPALDSLAASGMLFDRAYATPLCSSTRASLLTGQLAYRHGVGDALFPQDPAELSVDSPALPEVLQRASLSTAHFGKWHLTTGMFPDPETHPNRVGFDHFDGSLSNIGNYRVWPRTVDGSTRTQAGYHTRVMLEATAEWIESTPEPWYAQLSFQGAHAPWHLPPMGNFHTPVSENATDGELYLAMVENLDVAIGVLLDTLDPEIRERTLVVVMGDNGTPVLVAEPQLDEDAAKASVFEGGIRVPLVIAGPGVEPGRTDALVSVMDLLPTFSDLVGEPIPDEIDGLSLAPILHGERTRVRESLYIDSFAVTGERPTPEFRGQVVIGADHKLIVQMGLPPTLHEVSGFPEGPALDTPYDADAQRAYDALHAEYEAYEALTQAAWNDQF